MTRLALRAIERILRWTIAADCTCGVGIGNDAYHHPTCPHPLRKRRHA